MVGDVLPNSFVNDSNPTPGPTFTRSKEILWLSVFQAWESRGVGTSRKRTRTFFDKHNTASQCPKVYLRMLDRDNTSTEC